MATQYQGERLASRLRILRDRAEELNAGLASSDKTAEEILSPEEQGHVHDIHVLLGEVRELAHRVQKALTARKCQKWDYVPPVEPKKYDAVGVVVKDG